MSRSREKTDTVNQTLQSAVSDSKDKVNSLRKVADEVTKSRETVDKYVSDAKKNVEEEYHQCIERLNSDREKMMKKNRKHEMPRQRSIEESYGRSYRLDDSD